MLPHLRAREILQNVWPGAPLAAIQAIQGQALFEGNYGAAFGAANNWGAIQCGHKAPCKAGCVEAPDSHASGEVYRGCFRAYATPEEGAADFVKKVRVHFAVPDSILASGNADAIAFALRHPPKDSPSHGFGYFEAPLERYAQAIFYHSGVVAKALGEPHLVTRGSPDAPPVAISTADESDEEGMAMAGMLGSFAWLIWWWRKGWAPSEGK